MTHVIIILGRRRVTNRSITMGQRGSKYTSRKGQRNQVSDSPATRVHPTRTQELPPSRDSRRAISTSNGHKALPNPPMPPLAPQMSHNSSAGYQTAAIERFFTRYKDEEQDAILAEGVEKFCVDLKVDPTDFIMLVIAWKFQASEMCRFTRKEFVEGCKNLRVTDAQSLRRRFPDLIQETKSSEKSFKELYQYTFTFGLDRDQRALPADMAIALWELVFNHRKLPLLQQWFNFLQQSETRGISKDTWNMFLPFINTIAPDFSNYDEAEAWPSLFDDFVESELEKR